jgi:C-terminal processing protease CtpA/Prc
VVVHQQQLEVVLFRESNEDFGFSISDGLSDNGVYVNSIRDSGPASQAGMQPFDRIIQVNAEPVSDLDCQSVLPLLASSGNQLELIVQRAVSNSNTNSNNNYSSSSLSRNSHVSTKRSLKSVK